MNVLKVPPYKTHVLIVTKKITTVLDSKSYLMCNIVDSLFSKGHASPTF